MADLLPKPKRRLLSFSLRTLFVLLSVFGVWLGWKVNVVHERRAARKDIEASGGIVWASEPGAFPMHVPIGDRLVLIRPAMPVGWLRQMLGDQPVDAIVSLKEDCLTEAQVGKAKALFPEAKIVNGPPKIHHSFEPATANGSE